MAIDIAGDNGSGGGGYNSSNTTTQVGVVAGSCWLKDVEGLSILQGSEIFGCIDYLYHTWCLITESFSCLEPVSGACTVFDVGQVQTQQASPSTLHLVLQPRPQHNVPWKNRDETHFFCNVGIAIINHLPIITMNICLVKTIPKWMVYDYYTHITSLLFCCVDDHDKLG